LLRLFSSNPLFRGFLKLFYKPKRKLSVQCFGMEYNHPFGLAAGMDKRAEALRGWESIGLAFSEIGGVTMLEQEGNPKPRLSIVWDLTIRVVKK
jgi:dihydroorotate dehydrogenase